MNWSETILFEHSPSSIALLEGAPGESWEDLLKERETAAFDQGRREGEFSQSRRQQATLAQLRAEQEEVLNALRCVLPKLQSEFEAALIRLAIDAAERVVAGYPIEPGLVENVVRDALKQARKEDSITVILHPNDLSLLQEQGSNVLSETHGTSALSFAGSTDVDRGGCILQTQFGRIDARRAVRWKQLREAIQGHA